MNPTRYPWIDWLKALGILLVVAGHTPLPDEQHRMIYSFHMPLFFMISGFLISPGGFSTPITDFYQRRISKLIKLYFLFGLLGMAVYLYIFRHEQPLGHMLKDRTFSLLYASASHDTPRDLYPVVLWYFPALVTALGLTHTAWRIPHPWGKTTAISVLVIVGVTLHGRALPWELESGCIAAGFISLGHFARIRGLDQAAPKLALPIALIALAVGVSTAFFNRHTLDLRAATLGTPWLSIPAALLVILSLAFLFKRVQPSRLLAAVSAATILIFPTHTIAFPYVDRLALKIPALAHAVTAQAPWFSWTKAALVVCATALLHAVYHRISRALPATRR